MPRLGTLALPLLLGSIPWGNEGRALTTPDQEDVPKDRLLVTLPEDVDPTRVSFASHKGQDISYAVHTKGKAWFVVNGVKGKSSTGNSSFDSLRGPVVIPDGRRFAFVTTSGTEHRLVLTDETGRRAWVGPRSEPDSITDPQFSPNGDRWAFKGRQEGLGVYVAFDADDMNFHEDATPPLFDTWGHLHYWAKEKGRWQLLLDGKKCELNRAPASPVTHGAHLAIRNSGEFAYVAEEAGKRFVVEGKTCSDAFDDVKYLGYAPDDSVLAYVGRRKEKERMYVGGTPGPEFDLVGPPHFSKDGKILTYEATLGEAQFVMQGGKKHEVYKNIREFVPASDGSQFAYVYVEGGKCFARCGAFSSEGYDHVGTPQFTADGTILSFLARKGREIWWKISNLHTAARGEEKEKAVQKRWEEFRDLCLGLAADGYEGEKDAKVLASLAEYDAAKKLWVRGDQ